MAKYEIAYSDELRHHGILGMRWGQRNGPPYPLGYSQKNAREQKRISSSKHLNSKATESKHKGLTDKQKKWIKIGATVALTGLAVYGAYKISGSNINTIANVIPDPSVGQGFAKSQIDNIVNGVNPGYPNSYGSTYNCGNVAFAVESRFRGNPNIIARENENGMTVSQLLSYCRNVSSDNIIEDIRPNVNGSMSSKEISKIVSSTLEKEISDKFNGDARGTAFIPTKLGSHWFSWVKSGDSIQFIDGQSNNNSSVLDIAFSNYKYVPNKAGASFQVFRLDNVEFTDKINEVIRDTAKPNLMSSIFDSTVELGENFVMKKL